jgi:uncharacterized membrane protein YeaQ/YmgE (transglycosylase-associated protein family)
MNASRFGSNLRQKLVQTLRVILGAAMLLAFSIPGAAQTDTSAVPTGERLGTMTNEVRQKIEATGQAASAKLGEIWERIDERRLKNRTPDEIVAMVIMGLLVGSLLYRFGKRGQITSVLLGLVGAFIGGIVAHVTQLNLGLGPVLITYEDLLCTLAGGVLMLCGARWSAILKLFKGPVP